MALGIWVFHEDYKYNDSRVNQLIKEIATAELRIEEILKDRPKNQTPREQLNDPSWVEEAMLAGALSAKNEILDKYWSQSENSLLGYRISLWGGIAVIVICGSLIFWCYKREKEKASQ